MPLDVAQYHFADDGRVPNNPTLPLLVYRRPARLGSDPARALEQLFAGNGWTGSWRDGIYDFHHFHSTAHEVLGIARGTARVRFGGESGRTLRLSPGDIVVIPAGVGHKNKGATADLLVIGAYADGRAWDLCRAGAMACEAARSNIEQVPLPGADPVAGDAGPLIGAWHDGVR